MWRLGKVKLSSILCLPSMLKFVLNGKSTSRGLEKGATVAAISRYQFVPHRDASFQGHLVPLSLKADPILITVRIAGRFDKERGIA